MLRAISNRKIGDCLYKKDGLFEIYIGDAAVKEEYEGQTYLSPEKIPVATVPQSASSTVNYERMDVPVYTLDTRLHRPNSIGSPLIPEQNTRSQFDNAISEKLFPDIYHERASYNYSVSTVSFTTTINGKRTTFSSKPILMDKVSLDVQLALRETGIIYIHPKNKNDYYFDLEFLFEAN